MRRCVCPGSFDPVTLGHLDVINRAARLYDEVVVAVLDNPAKHSLFSLQERVELLTEQVRDLGGVRVMPFGGRLLVELCEQVDAQAIVKGLRGEVDYSYELPMAVMNRRLTGVETLFMPGEPGLNEVSSSLIKEVARYGGDVSGLLPAAVWAALTAKLAD
ncbi:pantetheine-phosphate adenylyltransferase [Kineosphaera limosa]|uniref:Phosphopantetheine adenylyltransferase n=1 Tax=Kineosphaera limosa NBRC 100340 TaxID=1184609 RepID=K6VP60_9MICO|nr:pantetheine-phosphate adenylyltransferase [Kineosphaera limosa]NYD99473.1 pantetheine-phosphate adenylyltransferase [Kineosphaera limosa]GAB98008.1 phosphopantetheine adenylyltransferase [Kineosphaera limosa NBRC 100340]